MSRLDGKCRRQSGHGSIAMVQGRTRVTLLCSALPVGRSGAAAAESMLVEFARTGTTCGFTFFADFQLKLLGAWKLGSGAGQHSAGKAPNVQRPMSYA